MLQGDITSPLYCILALDLILRLHHDKVSNKGLSFGQTVLFALGYADDAALIDYGDALGIARATERLSAIAKGSREDTGMTISIPKTDVIHVRAQEPITATSRKPS